MESINNNLSFLTPPINKGKEPPFYAMNSMAFQDLCRDLLAVQEEYIDCRIFGINGQSQKGIDILCTRKTNKVEAAQAKCYENFSVSEIKAASKAFLDNIEYWQKEGVIKFILIVASKIETVQENKQITEERIKFKQLGIKYELWDAIRLRDILRDHSGLIYTHIENADYWVKEIAGISSPPNQNQGMNYISLQVDGFLATKVKDLQSLINFRLNEELEENRIFLREGKTNLVLAWIKRKRDNTKEWLELSSDLKAKIIRLEAIISIDFYEDYVKAEQLIKEARESDPDGNDSRIRTILVLHRQGPYEALEIIKNMQDIESLCLKASIHLQLNQPTEALAILNPLIEQNNAEVYRLLALSYLLLKKIDDAIKTIGHAKNIAESWENVQITDAIVSYYSALSPAVFRDIYIDWPIPIKLNLIKNSTGATRKLEKAIEVFYKLSHDNNKSISNRHFLNVWLAACLACHFQRQEEAEECFRNLIQEFPTDYQIISWIFDRKYHIDMQLSHKSIKIKIKRGEASAIDFISCIMLDISRKLTKNSLFLLEKNKNKFIEEGNEKLYEYWYIQILILQKRYADALKVFSNSKMQADLESLRVLFIEHDCEENKNFEPYIKYLENSITNGDNPINLLVLCIFFASEQKWGDIIPYSGILVEEIQTVESLKLSSIALFQNGKFTECKKIIDENKHLCYEDNLPEDLKLIYIRCKSLLGNFSEALKDLREYTDYNPTKQSILMLSDFYLQKGDQAGLNYTATLAKEKIKLGSDELITLANNMLWTSREQAKDLWKMSSNEELSSDKLIEKYLLAFALGLDYETKEISALLPQKRFHKGGKFGYTTFEEARKIFEEKNKLKNELFRQYLLGDIPIHVLTNNTGMNLFTLYENLIDFNKGNSTLPQQRIPVYFRYGGKPSLADFKEPELPLTINHITLDVTSLLLLEHFSMLTFLENGSSEIYLSADTVRLLIQMKHELEQYQQQNITVSKLLSDCLFDQRIKEINIRHNNLIREFNEYEMMTNFISGLECRKGYIVYFGDYIQNWNSSGITNTNFSLITCSDLVISMRSRKLITENEKTIAINFLGNEGQFTSGADVEPGSELFFYGSTIELMAQTGVIDKLTEHYSVWMENSEILRIRASIKDETVRISLAQKLETLINRISQKLEVKKYIFHPITAGQKDQSKLLKNNPLLYTLVGEAENAQRNNSPMVIDDYFIQKHILKQGQSVLDIYDIAWGLHKQGIISDDKYYDILFEIRKSDLRYVPISSGEILYQLNNSKTSNTGIDESPGLKVLRTYISSVLIYGKKLEYPTQTNNVISSMAEFEYLMNLGHCLPIVLIKIWENNISDQYKQAQSKWIFDYIFLDFLGICEIVSWVREPKDQLFLVGVTLSQFFLQAVQFISENNIRVNRKKYFWWIYINLCEPRFRVNPGLLDITAKHIVQSLSDQITSQKDKEFNRGIKILCETLYQDLPDPIKTEINKDKKFVDLIGVKILTVVDLADIKFIAEEFWNQYASVLQGKTVSIKALSPKTEIGLSPNTITNGSSAIFTHPLTKLRVNIQSRDNCILLNKDYELWIDENKESFCEMTKSDLQRLMKQVSLGETPAKRLKRVDDLRSASIGYYYNNLEENLIKTQTLNFDQLLPPDINSLEQFLGNKKKFNKPSEITDLVNLSYKRLLTDHGIFAAISRLSAIPVDFPEFIIKEIRSYSLDERNNLFNSLVSVMISPINRIQLIRILKDYPEESDRISGLLEYWFSQEGKIETECFINLLILIIDAFDVVKGADIWSDDYKLFMSWGHTCQLFTIFKKCSIPMDWLNLTIKQKISPLPLKYLFTNKPKIWDDVANGKRLDWLSIKLLGLKYALNKSDFLSNNLQERILSEVFPMSENPQVPAIELFTDRNYGTNLLSSFLGDNLSEALHGLINKGDNRLKNIETNTINELTFQAIGSIRDIKDSIPGWQILLRIFTNRYLPDEFRGEFEEVILKYNFMDLIKESYSLGYLALFFCSYQASHLSQIIQVFLETQFVEFIRNFELQLNNENQNGKVLEKDDNIALLLETAINFSLISADGNCFDKLTDYIHQLVMYCPDSRNTLLHLINPLVNEVPIPYSQKLGKIILELRSF